MTSGEVGTIDEGEYYISAEELAQLNFVAKPQAEKRAKGHGGRGKVGTNTVDFKRVLDKATASGKGKKSPYAAVNGKRPKCRHCKRRFMCRPRGLCHKCYYTPGVRATRPSQSKYANRGYGNKAGAVPLDDWGPTAAVPGSEAKLRVMTGRAKRSVALFHPADAMYPGDDSRVSAWFQSSETRTAA